MDLIGPIIPASNSGHRYVLVMVDYATRYPEAVPLKNISAEEVAEAAFGIWTRTGIPEKVLTDQGSQFMGKVMTEVYKLLSITGQRTSPYHAQCNGLVERFNGTLKQMLRRLAQEQPRDWDRWIPAVLFAYREVPQASTGYSPFELIYGKRVRGPMKILRDLWAHPDQPELQNVATYVSDLRNRIATSCAIAQENLQTAATAQKQHFDMKAKNREMKKGDKVLVLRPMHNNKLELAWKGPYTVLQRMGPADYRIQVGPVTKIFHANMLRKFVERQPELQSVDVNLIAVVHEEETSNEQIEEEVLTAPIIGCEIPVIPLEATEKPSDVKIKTEDPAFANQLKELVNEFSDVFTDLPKMTNLAECQIKCTTETPPRCRVYPVPFAQRETVKKEVQAMLDMGVIEPSVSPYSSPIVLVKKPDGKIRFCIDYRELNKVVEFDAEPMPNIDFLFTKLAEKKIFTKIDLSKGYWQIPMAEEDRPKTAFSTPMGHFQWKVMPFGLMTSGAIFTRMMRNLLQPLQCDEVDNFIDDIMVGTENEERHIEVLRMVLGRLREGSLAARPTKCEMGCSEVVYLGHTIGQGVVKPEEKKMEKIAKAEPPRTKKEVRSFLGMVGFYRRFIPRFSEIAKPLTDLTKGAAPRQVKWSEECDESFNRLKKAISSAPVCCLPIPGKPFVLRTDASEIGMGAILFQEHEDGLRPVSCASKKFNSAERNYATIEKECYALVWGVQKFAVYLYGVQFVVQTDHAPLKCLHRLKSTSGRITRWALQIQPYSFTVESIPGVDNVAADYLSRL